VMWGGEKLRYEECMVFWWCFFFGYLYLNFWIILQICLPSGMFWILRPWE
jgi:hypothetical protein